MVLIYNLSGLLVGLLGLIMGFLVFVLTGWLSPALLVLGAIWLAMGRARPDPETGLKRPAPALFFIPLYFLSISILLLAIPAVLADFRGGKKQQDPRYVQLKQDERELDRTKLTGDKDLAQAAYEVLKAKALDDKTHVHASIRDQSVLILAKVPSLKELDPPDRAALVKALTETLEGLDAAKGRLLYLGIKGRFSYGVVQTPAGSRIGTTVLSDPLLDFYGPPPPRTKDGAARE